MMFEEEENKRRGSALFIVIEKMARARQQLHFLSQHVSKHVSMGVIALQDRCECQLNGLEVQWCAEMFRFRIGTT